MTEHSPAVSAAIPAIDLSLLIVSWNVRDLLIACLESIAASPLALVAPGGTAPGDGDLLCAEVIVVDSASSDGTPALVAEQFPWVRLFAPGENVGFTRGNNLALAAARGRHLLLLNPDTVVHDDALPTLVAYLDAHPQVGIAGPRVLNADGTTQSTRRRFPTALTAFFESTWLQGYAPRRLLDRFYVADLPDDGTFEVDWVQGCALIARRAVYEQIGGLDEGYVMFSEELDWCRRAKDAGWRVAYVGAARITHYGGQSTAQVETRKHIHFQQSKLRYFRTYHGRALALALRLFLLVSYGLQMALEGAKGALGHKRALRRARVCTYWAVIRALARG
ncbi:MAG: glycosyltransferase family 2 protein [Anaerolineae bacterium]|nr:glycosyltransferase family 2 protein [Anaerolineae bacterium]